MSILENCLLYAILDTGYTRRDAWESTARALIEGGVDILQIRAKGSTEAEILSLAQAVLPMCTDHGVPLIINDAVQVAARLPGAGAHIGQDDLSPLEAREILGPDRILGLSTHSPSQIDGALKEAERLDYFAVGPVFATPTKPTYEPVGLELVAHAAARKPPLPFFCIGGVKRHNVAEIMAAGGSRVVVVSGLLLAPDPAAEAMHYREILQANRSN